MQNVYLQMKKDSASENIQYKELKTLVNKRYDENSKEIQIIKNSGICKAINELQNVEDAGLQ